MYARAIAIALLVAASFGVATPLVAAALRTKPRCCHTTACPMMVKQSSSSASFASCDADGKVAPRGGQTPAILTTTITLAHGATATQTFPAIASTRHAESSFAIDHPPEPFLV